MGEAIQKALESDSIVKTQYFLNLPVGLRFFETRISPLRDHSAVLALVRDVTELKEAQDSLAETERLYRQAIAAAGGVPYQVEFASGRYTFMGDAIEQLTGYSAAEMNHALWLEIGKEHTLYGPLSGLSLEEAREAVMQGAVATWRHDVRIRTKEGEMRWISDVSVELRDESGRSTGSIGFLLDITERKRIEMALQESESLFRSLFEESPDGIFLIDPEIRDGDNLIVDCNRAACEMNGYSRDELIGHPISILNVDTVEQTERIERLRREGTVHLELLHRHKDGTIFPIEASTTIAFVNGRELILGFDRDITQRKAMEAELRRAKENAEAANQAKSDFLSNMSHEIRTPMNGVIGMTSLLLDTGLSDEQMDYVKTIRSSGDHLLAVINDILDFSKIESGKLELESLSFNLRECVEASVDLFAGEAAQKEVELVMTFAADLPHFVNSDPTRLRQILTNLIGNAIKFTYKGEVVITTTREADENGLVRLRFAVRDTGIGIPPASQERLFKSFSQVDASTARKFGGSGLGLAISRRICQAMGGDLQVESKPGVGSTFYFDLTLPVPDESIGPTKAAGPFTPSPVQRKRLLVVDDNRTAREWAISLAERKGWIAEGANAGLVAAQMLSGDSQFDAVLVDIALRDMHGLELIDKLRQGMGKALIPVILHAPPGTIDAATVQRTKAIQSLLPKPLKEAELDRVLYSLFQPKSAPISPRQQPEFNHREVESKRLRILLAEDNLVNQKVAQRMLDKLGYRVDVAANGIEALAALRRQPYDLVLMDIQMPDMDGLEATRQIQVEWKEEDRPRIVAMTAHAHAEARKLCEETGMDDYITKPVRVDDLVQMLQRAESSLVRPGAKEVHRPENAVAM